MEANEGFKTRFLKNFKVLLICCS